MTFIRDIAPWEKMQSRSRVGRVKESEILDCLSRHNGSSCDEIAYLLDKDEISVQKVLQQLEIKGKVTPKMIRLGAGLRDRECFYYIIEEKPNPPKPLQQSKPESTKPKPESKKQFSQTGNKDSKSQPRKYFPPFIDQKGEKYETKESVAERFKVSFDTINHWLCSGKLGSNGALPTKLSSKIKKNPPFIDQQGDQYQSREEIITALNISNKELSRLLCVGKVGSDGNPPAITTKIERKDPPFVDWQGEIYQSRDAICERFEISRHKLNDWLSRGIIGFNGRKGRCPHTLPRKFKPPFIDQEGKQYDSRQEIKLALDISDKCLSQRLSEGSIGVNGNPPTRRKKKRCVTDGIEIYPSIKACAIAYNLSNRTVGHRLASHNYPNWHYIEPRRRGTARAVTDGVNIHPSIRACAIAHNLTDKAVAYRINSSYWKDWSYN